MFLQNINFFSIKFVINLLISIIPISYIAGNLVLNLNIVLIIITSFSFFGKEIIQLKLCTLDKIILAFFLYIFLNGFYNNYFNFNFADAPKNYILFKSLLYFRYLFFYLAIRYLVLEKIIDFKIIFLSFGLVSFFVSIDLIIQFIFGKDLFGHVGSSRRLQGPFGNEYIAGSFLQRFSFFSISSLILFLNFKNKINFKLSIFFLISILSISIILSGNRVPVLMFFIMLCLAFIFQKELRKIFLFFVSIIFIFMIYLASYSENYKIHFEGFANKSYQIVIYLKDKVNNNEINFNKIAVHNLHIKEMETGIETSKLNMYFGGGLRSFYWNCSKINPKVLVKVNRLGGCNSHPHNYYLEISANLGIAGLIFTSVIFLGVAIRSLKFFLLKNQEIDSKNLLIPFFLIFIAEVFPIKSTGSFFTSGNSIFIFFIIAFIISLSDYNKLLKK